MATLAELLIALGVDASGLKSGLTDAENSATKSAAAIGKKLESIGAGLTSAGTKMTAGMTVPIVGGFVASIDAASDMDETMSKVGRVFGDSADDVQAFAQGAATNLGMSSQAALEATGTFGNLFTSMGQGQQPAAEMSMGLVQVAADLGSFNNMDPTEVLEKLRSGIVGETEPLRSLGINLTDSTVKAEAMRLGLAESADQLTQSALLTARYSLITQMSKNATGDFALTSDGLANSTRIMKAQLSDAAARLGIQLLPIAIDVVKVFRDLLSGFQSLSPEMQRNITIVLGVAAAMGPLLIVVGMLISAFGTILPVITTVAGVLTGPLGIAIALIVGAVALLALAWKNNWGDIQGKVQAVLEWMKPFIDNALTGVKQVFKIFNDAFKGDWTAFGEDLRILWNTVWEAIKTAASNAWTWLQNIDWGQVGEAIVTAISTGVTNFINWLLETIGKLGDIIGQVIAGWNSAGSQTLTIESYSSSTSMDEIPQAFWANGVSDFVVPSGYPNDTFRAGLSSGEVVSVTPAGSGGMFSALLSEMRSMRASIERQRPATADDIGRSIRDNLAGVVG